MAAEQPTIKIGGRFTISENELIERNALEFDLPVEVVAVIVHDAKRLYLAGLVT